MKKRKLVAVILALSVAASVSGCSKVSSVSGEEVIDACEELDYDEIELDDNLRGFDPDAMEGGFYFSLEGDKLDQIELYVSPYLRMTGLDLGLDFDNIDEIIVFGNAEGMDDFDDMDRPGDLEDVEAEFLAGLQITLDEYDRDVVNDIADGIDDMLRKANIDVDDLRSSEYRLTADSLFLKLHVDFEELAPAFLESEICEVLLDNAPNDDEADEFTEAVANMTGHGSIAIYVADGNVFIIADVAVNCLPSLLREFAAEVDVDDPSKLPSSDVAIEGLIESLDDYSDAYMRRALSYNSDYGF